ncbi:STAS domain-containing protein [Streptomyces olivoreticuli]|uniref:STAS domain-containing protein n=1 Tax=Streptomyces olivoreticuli TaxID=68246 RepID=UPI00265AA0C7|nr:STAS domain-containing protein [Streptomyces olivoreticuli]WKK27305.1 STAS domain-containing protein [Streptomyces olivoreticuli]
MEDQWPAELENCRVVCPAGELDVATALVFAVLLRGTALAAGADWLIVDLGRVTFMDCSPLRDLCTAWDRSRATGRWTRVVYDQASIGRLLRLTLLQERFPRYASIDDAWSERFTGADV